MKLTIEEYNKKVIALSKSCAEAKKQLQGVREVICELNSCIETIKKKIPIITLKKLPEVSKIEYFPYNKNICNHSVEYISDITHSRTINALCNYCPRTETGSDLKIKDVLTMSKGEIFKFRNFGRKSLQDLEIALHTHFKTHHSL